MEERGRISLAHRLGAAAMAAALFGFGSWMLYLLIPGVGVAAAIATGLVVLAALLPPRAVGAAFYGLGIGIGLVIRFAVFKPLLLFIGGANRVLDSLPEPDERIRYIQRRRREGIGMRQAKREYDEGRQVPAAALPSDG